MRRTKARINQQTRQNLLRLAWRESGRCGKCGRRAAAKRRHCPRHLRYYRELMRERRPAEGWR